MKIYGVYPRSWQPGYDWFDRQVGLLVVGLNDAGIESRLVLLAGDAYVSPTADKRILFAQRTEMLSASWWASLGVDALIFEGAANAAYLPYLSAIHAAGIRVHAPLDSDGLVDPAIDFRGYWLARYSWAISRGIRLPSVHATAHSLARLAIPSSADSRLLYRLGLLSSFSAESPLAIARLRSYFQQRKRLDLEKQLFWLPHAVPSKRFDGVRPQKEKLIVSAARWNDEQKGASLFVELASTILASEPDYRIEVAGVFSEELARAVAAKNPAVAKRICGVGRLPNEKITDFLSRAQMFLVTSRSEGFPNVVADAVCCGCSIVAPARVAAMHFFASHDSGTLAWSRSPAAMQHALVSEIDGWRNGFRDPDSIANHFGGLLNITNVTNRVLKLLTQPEIQLGQH